MCHSIRIDRERKLAEITASGTVDFSELKEIFMEIVGHEDWQAGFNMLCDYRKIDNLEVTSQDIDTITEWQTAMDSLIGSGKCAVVASKDSVYGMSRMWEILSSDRSQRICVFRRLNDAVLWLNMI